jgi:hypothetical protein
MLLKRFIQALDALVTTDGAIGAVEAPHTAAVITWTATLAGASVTLEAAKGEPLRLDLRRLVIVPDNPDDDVRHTTDGTDADATSPRFPAYGLSEPVTKAVADQYRFFATAGSLTVKEYGD